jgi:hypothetical protein
LTLQERLAMVRELERLQREEAAAAAAKKARAAALMEEVRNACVIDISSNSCCCSCMTCCQHCCIFLDAAPCAVENQGILKLHWGTYTGSHMMPCCCPCLNILQVAASNSEQIERKKQLAQQEWEEEMRIAEYIRQKDAREQVRLRAGVSTEQ